jgi:hypothetical protein
MPKRTKRNTKRRGTSSERKEDGSAAGSDTLGSDAGSQDEVQSVSNDAPEVVASATEAVEAPAEVAPAADAQEVVAAPVKADPAAIVETPAVPVVEEPVVEKAPESPAKDDQVLDAAAASPFLTPSAVGVKPLESEAAIQEAELTFSPGSDAAVPNIDTAETESPPLMVSHAPAEDDLLRQSVDLATIPAPATPSITITVEPLEIIAPSPAASLPPLSTKTPMPPVAYPQSPMVVVPTPSAANPPAPSVVVLENANSTMNVVPMTPSLSVPPIPIADSPKTVSIPLVVESPKVVNIPVVAESPKVVSIPGSGLGTPAAPTIPETSAAMERISAFISEGSSPPRGTGLDSLALAEDPNIFKSIPPAVEEVEAPAQQTITASLAVTDAPFVPLDSEAAMLKLTGRSSKPQTEMSAPVKPSGFLSMCANCFGFSKSKIDGLEEERDVQTTLLSTPFDAQLETHRRMLQSFANEPLALIDEEWKKFGFRTVDPSGELNEKGNGVFHALCLLYGVQELGKSAQVGANGIMISSAVVAMAKAGDLNELYNKHRQVLVVTCHVYCALMKRFLEVGDVNAVVVQAQAPAGLQEILDQWPLPQQVVRK